MVMTGWAVDTPQQPHPIQLYRVQGLYRYHNRSVIVSWIDADWLLLPFDFAVGEPSKTLFLS